MVIIVIVKLVLIRHGLTQANIERRYLGRTDVPLCDAGIQELRELGIFPKVELVFSSPLIRCIETAKVIYSGTPITIINELAEIDFGDWEMKTYEDLQLIDAYREWIDSRGTNSPPKGESRSDLEKRLEQALLMLAGILEEQGIETAAVITHGGCIMTLMSHNTACDGDYYRWQCKAGEGFKVEFDTQTFEFKEVVKIGEV